MTLAPALLRPEPTGEAAILETGQCADADRQAEVERVVAPVTASATIIPFRLNNLTVADTDRILDLARKGFTAAEISRSFWLDEKPVCLHEIFQVCREQGVAVKQRAPR